MSNRYKSDANKLANTSRQLAKIMTSCTTAIAVEAVREAMERIDRAKKELDKRGEYE